MGSANKPVMTGVCQGGGGRIALSAAPVKISICHCRMCQKAAGAPFASFAEIERSAFALTRGQPSAFRSSSLAERDICAACGTPMVWQGNAHPDWLDVGVGTFDDAHDFILQDHLWQDSALPWLKIDDQLPRYPRARPKSKLPKS